MPRGPNHVFSRHVLHCFHEPGVEAALVVGDRGEHELAHHLRVPDGDLQGDAGSHAVTEDVGLFDSEMLECSGGVVGHLLDGQRAIYIGRASMGLQLEGDDLPGLCKFRQNVSERGADCRKSAVEQNQRLSRSVDLVVHIEAVHLNVVASKVVVHSVSFRSYRQPRARSWR
jgi:hypothetical protein